MIISIEMNRCFVKVWVWLIHLFTLSLFAVVIVVVVKVLWYLYLEQVCGFRNIGV